MTEQSTTARAAGLLERMPWYTIPGILVGVPLLFTILGKLSREFYVHVVWKYYWGPIKADAAPGTDQLTVDGVVAHAGYNIVNTLSWAVLLAVCILGIAQMLHRFKAPADEKLILGASAWVVSGAVWHVLQDSKLIEKPLEFIFITPPIYLLFGAFGIFSFLFGQYAKKVWQTSGSLEQGLQKIWFLFMILVVGYVGLWLKGWDQIVIYVNPVWVAGFAILTFAVIRYRAHKTQSIDATELVLTMSIGPFLLALAYVWSYIQDPWPGKIPDDSLQWAFVIAPALAGAVTGIVYLIARKVHAGGKEAALAFMAPMNLVLIFSQMVDAFATALGIDLGTYSEKHILSEFVRSSTEKVGSVFAEYPTFLGFAPLKLAISLAVVYAIDIQGKEDAKKYPTLIGLVKFAIIMVGIGPGVRNMVRMSLGI